jgi:hypothetical protein
MRFAMLLALLLPAATALAGSQHESSEQPLKAQAYLDFRIVIPETLHIRSSAERRKRVTTFVSRTTRSHENRTVVTVAQP